MESYVAARAFALENGEELALVGMMLLNY